MAQLILILMLDNNNELNKIEIRRLITKE